MKKLDMEVYPRKAHFDYFKTLANPYVGTTVNVDVTNFLAKIKRDGLPFFLTFLWHAARSANAIPEFRRRVLNGDIVEFDNCLTSHTVAKPDGTYAYCTLECAKPLDEFIPYAKEKQLTCASCGNIDEDAAEALGFFFISTVPWLSYTSLVQPTPTPADSNPRITWGGYFEQSGKMFMPVSVLCNHAVVDGVHISKFYSQLTDSIN